MPDLHEGNTSGTSQPREVPEGGEPSVGKGITDDAITRLTRWLVRWTAALVFVGIIGAIVAYFQWQALLKTDHTTRESFSAVQRPFIVASGLEISKQTEGASTPLYWRFRTILENNGNTPTKNMTVTSPVSFSIPVVAYTPPDPADLKPISTEATPKSTDYFVGPHSKAGVDAISLFFTSVDEMAKGRSDFFIYGIARYNDQFVDTQERITKFCLSYILS